MRTGEPSGSLFHVPLLRPCHWVDPWGTIWAWERSPAIKTMEVITRKQAKEQGLKHYFTGKPCKHGHVRERHTSSGSCLECRRLLQLKQNKDNPEKLAAYRAKSYAKNRNA